MITGVTRFPIEKIQDRRGWLAEIYRQEWDEKIVARQINVMTSVARSLRGSHVHGKHHDYFYVPYGNAIVGLKDVRKSSSSYGKIEFEDLRSGGALSIPPGVVHGVYFPSWSILVTVETLTYDPSEEFAVRWDDPELGIPWPPMDPILPEGGDRSPSYREMMEKLEPYQKSF